MVKTEKDGYVDTVYLLRIMLVCGCKGGSLLLAQFGFSWAMIMKHARTATGP